MVGNFLHFPKGNGSYTVAENLARYVPSICNPWAVGENSSQIYNDGTFPVFLSHPQSSGKRFSNLNRREYQRYLQEIEKAISDVPEHDLALVHHGFILARKLSERFPVISYLHGTEMLALQSGLPDYVAEAIHSGISVSKEVLVMSEKQKTLAEKLFCKDLKKEPIVVTGGFDNNIFYPCPDHNFYDRVGIADEKRKILFAGRITPEKGIDDLIRAFSDHSFSYDKQLIIVGDGNEKPGLMDLAMRLGIDARFLPAQRQDELARIMSSSDLFVLPSHYESFGLVCVESLACGTPVVGSDVGVLEDLIIPGRGGYVFKREEDYERTARNIRDAIVKSLHLDTLSFNAHAQMIREVYSWDTISHRFQRIINDNK